MIRRRRTKEQMQADFDAWILKGRMKEARTPVKRKRSGGPRKGRVVDEKYLAWIAARPCMISGRRSTVHHVRFCGSPKNDRRTLPLAPEYHQIQPGPHTSIEALGKAKFEARYGVDIESAIAKYNEQYQRETGITWN